MSYFYLAGFFIFLALCFVCMSRVLSPTPSNISRCARLIQKGKLVVFPTETVYGLGANAFDETAVKQIFAVKNRPKKNPLIVHVSSWKMVESVCKNPLSSREKKLLTHFWPGPLTVVVPKSDLVSDCVTAGLSTVAIRWPSNRIARRLIEKAGVPIAAPSANPSSKPSPTLSSHVEDLKGVAAILDGGKSVFGIESTVMDLEKKLILRPGPVTPAELGRFWRGVRLHPSLLSKKKVAAPSSPGMKYKHYSPKCKIFLVKASSKRFVSFAAIQPCDMAVICSTKVSSKLTNRLVFSFSSAKNLAANLFAFFYLLDQKKVKTAIIQAVPEQGIGFSVMNRISKAASKTIEL